MANGTHPSIIVDVAIHNVDFTCAIDPYSSTLPSKESQEIQLQEVSSVWA